MYDIRCGFSDCPCLFPRPVIPLICPLSFCVSYALSLFICPPLSATTCLLPLRPPVPRFSPRTCEAIEVLKSHFHDAARQQAGFLIATVLLAAHKTLIPQQQQQQQQKQQKQQGTVQCLQPHVLQLWQTQLYPLLFAIISEVANSPDGAGVTTVTAAAATTRAGSATAGAVQAEQQ